MTPAPAVAERSEVVDDPGFRGSQLIWVVTAFIFAVIALRVTLHAVGANQSSSFVSFINDVSWPFVAPFGGIVADRDFGGGQVLESGAIIAAVVWLLAGALLAMLARAMFGPRPASRTVVH